MTRVLIVDDDPVQLRLTAEVARRADFVPVTASGGEEALRLLRAEPGFAAVILDLVMPDRDGLAVMEAMTRERIGAPVIVQTAHSSLDTVVSAMRHGAADFFVKPVAPERLIVSLRNLIRLGELETEVRTERHRRAGTLGLSDIVTRSPAMHRVLGLTQKAAKSTLPVLLEGEAGTGKELLARVIHGMGDRASRPFVAVNCATTAALEAALFSPGGKFTEATGGTLFLEEIGEIPLATQSRLAAELTDRSHVRVIASTSRRLLGLAQSGEVREDLYYRLNVFPMYLPPLRERLEDIEPLSAALVARFAAEARKRIAGISAPALDLLRAYNWPGNIRQLESILYRAIILSDGGYLEIADFPQLVADARGRDASLKLTETLPLPSAPVHIDSPTLRKEVEAREAVQDRFLDASGDIRPLDQLERELIEFALKRYGGRMSRIARALGIGRSTLYRKLRDYGLESDISDAA